MIVVVFLVVVVVAVVGATAGVTAAVAVAVALAIAIAAASVAVAPVAMAKTVAAATALTVATLRRLNLLKKMRSVLKWWKTHAGSPSYNSLKLSYEPLYDPCRPLPSLTTATRKTLLHSACAASALSMNTLGPFKVKSGSQNPYMRSVLHQLLTPANSPQKNWVPYSSSGNIPDSYALLWQNDCRAQC